jgi:alkylation response protein AidB-like acyl-CoA dehydrogenase
MKKYTPRWHDDEVTALSDLAVDFFEREVVAHVERWDAQRRIDRELWLAAGKLGLPLCPIPEEYGGGGGTFAGILATTDSCSLRPRGPLDNCELIWGIGDASPSRDESPGEHSRHVAACLDVGTGPFRPRS